MKLRVDLSYRNTLPAIQITFETRTNNHKLAQNEKNPLAQTDARLLCGRLWVLSIALKKQERIAGQFLQYSYEAPVSN